MNRREIIKGAAALAMAPMLASAKILPGFSAPAAAVDEAVRTYREIVHFLSGHIAHEMYVPAGPFFASNWKWMEIYNWTRSIIETGNAYAYKVAPDKLVLLDPNHVEVIGAMGGYFYRIGGPDGYLVTPHSMVHDKANCFCHPMVGMTSLEGVAALQGRISLRLLHMEDDVFLAAMRSLRNQVDVEEIVTRYQFPATWDFSVNNEAPIRELGLTPNHVKVLYHVTDDDLAGLTDYPRWNFMLPYVKSMELALAKGGMVV